ncbi:cytochrome P450 [Bisporella sp. PMI_857]|nr:cytochrome P450 [Bisporella sp. PMI_857]
MMAARPNRMDENTTHAHSIVFNLWTLLQAHWILAITAIVIFRFLINRYASPLRRYPGPFLASGSRLWKVLSTASAHTHIDHIALHKRFGPIVRIGPNEVSLASPEAARLVLSAGKHFYKTDFYAVFPPPENPDIFTEVREDVHARKKKVANVPYSMAAMQQLSPFIDDTIEFFVAKLKHLVVTGEPTEKVDGKQRYRSVNLGDWLHYFAFDVLGEVAFSRSFGFLSEGMDVGNAIRTIDNSQWYNGIVGQIPWIDHILRRNPLWKLFPQLNTKNALITKLAIEEMAKRRPFETEGGLSRSGDGRQDLLASLIKGHLKDPERFSEGDVFAVAHGAIFAGSDSTASTMQSFFWLVLSSPRIYASLIQEIQDAVKCGTIPLGGNLSWSEAQSLPYFQACLKEAMRVRPAVGLNITRVVPPEGFELDGYIFPGGTRIAVNGWVLHRDRTIFGQDADLYRPERWLERSEKDTNLDRYMFQFGGGAHVCIGRNLALLEINKVIPRLLRDYHLQLVHPARELRAKATFFVVQEGLEVYMERRDIR